MAANIATGKASCARRAAAGFTLMELLLVLTLIAILASLVGPTIASSMQRARESALKEDLHVLRRALDDYYADNGSYPAQLQELAEKRYVRRVPIDPFTGSSETWQTTNDDSGADDEGGVRDVQSGAEGQASDGSYFKDW